MIAKIVRLFVPGVLVLLSGCAGMWHTPYEAASEASVAPPLPQEAEIFNYTPVSQAPRTSRMPDIHANYDKYLVEFDPVHQHGMPAMDMTSHYYRSKSKDVYRLVIVLPIWGNDAYPPKRITSTLLRRSKGDFDVLHLLGDEPLFDLARLKAVDNEVEFVELAEQMAGRVADAVIGIRQMVDWAHEHTGLEVAVVGFSMGAMVGSIAMGVDDRISSGVLMMGAGNPGEVFATCKGKLGRVRSEVLPRIGWSRDQYREFFEGLFAAGDPRSFAGRYDPQNILLIDGMFDGCMSRRSRIALWEATSRPERLTFISNHKWSFISMTPVALNITGRKIHDFLSRHPERRDERYARR